MDSKIAVTISIFAAVLMLIPGISMASPMQNNVHHIEGVNMTPTKLLYRVTSFNGSSDRSYIVSTTILSCRNGQLSLASSYGARSLSVNTIYIAPLSDFQFNLSDNKYSRTTVVKSPFGENMVSTMKIVAWKNLVRTESVSLVANNTTLFSLKIILVGAPIASISSEIGNTSSSLYYLFIPQLLAPTQASTINGSQANSPPHPLIIPIPPGGGGGTYYTDSAQLNEYDNHVTNYNIWNFEVALTVTSFTSGSAGWSGYVNGVAVSPLNNWQLKSDSVQVTESGQTSVTANGNAYFYGVFPYAAYSTWYAYPEIKVTIYNTGSASGYIHDTVYGGLTLPPILGPSTILWSDLTLYDGPIYGYKGVSQWIVDQ